ncbi:N-acetylneuraminate synthase family protein [Leptospira levettii]|uniref:N-acetylneuraminate synthase family protein n=1 Tax=Leptospira levettii TaxID=2023178 RepID=A0AAW5VF22_9LEPT|nr:N-acetylneuraminate synthase family protein [Leptospira levettii]MCW7466194.1 N-acetylneuraminate synthase family protein [Leptospira levettii]MCW7512281.1 N-acetylneuraminate synthase family protein [Leptospira levettii]MCW7516289.1 N-acetylneuraminate synthase family protein [Leptospira levettii]
MIKIGNFEIGKGRTFIIAEIGNNHNGDLKKAYELVDVAVSVGADCAKFQMRHLDEVYRQKSLKKSGEDLGTEYILDLLEKFELDKEFHRKLNVYCLEKGILYLCTPWDNKSVDILESFPVPAYKVASADLTNVTLLDRLIETNKPLILSTGMSKTEEIIFVRDYLNKANVPFIFLHCNSTYPAPLHDINLKWMSQLKEFHNYIGYSGHERGINVTLASIVMGAMVIERHLTLDRNMEGPDHAASLEANEFSKLVKGIREIEEALGTSQYERKLSQGEMINRENLSKSCVAARPIQKGTVITKEMIKILSPGQGLSPQKINDLIGKKIQRDLLEEDYFFPSDLIEKRIEPKQYKFSRPWGVPVRYHDFQEYYNRVKPDLFEFHLSYSDMELDPAKYLNGTYDCEFVVHAPELFEGSHLMDLATPDDTYRKISLKETQRVIDITRSLKQYFPKTKRPFIVANVGGISMDGNLPKEILPSYYQTFGESLKMLNQDGVELIPQTMAPFPWHFGGQRYQNIFVHIAEIEEWCKKFNLRMCYDVSHTMLTCNHFGYDFYDFSERIAPFTAHIHMGDAKGLNGEGLQVGEGEIDFQRLGKILGKLAPNAWFIPEIWQGHKNGGEGFWIALERLEGIL